MKLNKLHITKLFSKVEVSWLDLFAQYPTKQRGFDRSLWRCIKEKSFSRKNIAHTYRLVEPMVKMLFQQTFQFEFRLVRTTELFSLKKLSRKKFCLRINFLRIIII